MNDTWAAQVKPNQIDWARRYTNPVATQVIAYKQTAMFSDNKPNILGEATFAVSEALRMSLPALRWADVDKKKIIKLVNLVKSHLDADVAASIIGSKAREKALTSLPGVEVLAYGVTKSLMEPEARKYQDMVAARGDTLLKSLESSIGASLNILLSEARLQAASVTIS